MEEKQKYRSCRHAMEQSPSATVELETSKIVEVETREKERKRAEVETSRKTKKKKNSKIFRFDGKEYKTYSAMVDAKREHNWIWLEKSGVQEAAQHLMKAKTGQQFATFRQQEHTPSGHDTDATTNSPNKLSMILRPRQTSKLFGQ
jgi:hypothetical protein